MERGGRCQPTFLVTGGDLCWVLSSSSGQDQRLGGPVSGEVPRLGASSLSQGQRCAVRGHAEGSVPSHPWEQERLLLLAAGQSLAGERKGRERVSHHHCSQAPGLCSLSLSPPQIATTRRLTVHFNPPSSCVLEISVRGVKIAVKADDSKEHSKVVPCSLLISSLPRLLARAPSATGHVCIQKWRISTHLRV